MSLRPILKRSPTHSSSNHAVHFPPSSSLTTHTYSVYSSTTYDRSPIIVSPNTCAMPERGCPGRTYTLEDPSDTKWPRHHYPGRDLHPRAMAAPSREVAVDYMYNSRPPPLVPDISSSESDESDGFSTPHAASYTPSPHHVHGLAIPTTKDRYDSYNSYDPTSSYDTSPLTPSAALSFLPHPPSPPSRSPYTYDVPTTCGSPQAPQSKRRKERKHDPSRTPDRIPYAQPESPCLTKSSKSNRAAVLSKSFSTCHSASYRVEDDGCLGGF